MNKEHKVEFIEVEEDTDFFERMGRILETNNQTIMIAKRLSKRDALEIIDRGQSSMNNHNDIIDTYEEESKIIYPSTNTEEGMKKVLKINKLVRYMKTKADVEDDSGELILLDKKEGLYYQPESTYFKVKRKDLTKEDGIGYEYYSVVLLHDISKYVREEIKLLEDPTTGVPSKKQLMPMILDVIEQSIIKKQSFALTLVDIDFFKKINDTYGHQFGDKILKAFAQLINRSIRHDDARTNDIMCRVGGEEFIFTLNNINWENAVKTNERIRAKVEKNLKNFDNIDIDLTCSMGMVFIDYEQMKSINPSDKADKKKMKELANKIIKEADDYMYISKNSGRNRVTVVKYKSEKDKDIEDK